MTGRRTGFEHIGTTSASSRAGKAVARLLQTGEYVRCASPAGNIAAPHQLRLA